MACVSQSTKRRSPVSSGDLARAEDLHREDLQARAVQEIERAPQIPAVRKSLSTIATPRPRCWRRNASIPVDRPASRRRRRYFRETRTAFRMLARPLLGAAGALLAPPTTVALTFSLPPQSEHSERGGELLRECELALEHHRAATHRRAARRAFPPRDETASDTAAGCARKIFQSTKRTSSPGA